MTDKIKLYYFDLPGRGEQIRCLLRHAKVQFEDVRFAMDKWAAEKPNARYEYGQCPVMEFNGKIYSQSPAIMHFLGMKYGYCPSDPEEMYEVLSIYHAALDVINALYKFAYTVKEPKEKEELRKDYFAKYVPFMFGKFEEKLKAKKNKKFIVGEKMTYADLGFAGLAKAEFLAPTNLAEYEKIYVSFPLFKAYLTELSKI